MRLPNNEKKKNFKSFLFIFGILFAVYFVIWFVWDEFEYVINEFTILPHLRLAKKDWDEMYFDEGYIETNDGNIEIIKRGDTTFLIKYKNLELEERGFKYFNVRYIENGVLLSFPAFYIRGIKNIYFYNNKIYEFYKVPIDLIDCYDELFTKFLLGQYKKINENDLPEELKNGLKENVIYISSKYTNFVIEDIENIYKIDDYKYLFEKETELFKEYYIINIEHKNYILRIYLVEKR
ncbi:hypothetical protein LN42_07560 [Marinitoga sp. 1137]|uniref:hypothetical protein n=1 Tax=Marinitoga sp. 1137 TaxID=1545835 RepID=UPI00095061E9|nr:hypothetical protein [Marinitoga sp. 1137]APT76254.1 hypothetical protein LN42_07560 [Marinitoga sp. 1137]